MDYTFDPNNIPTDPQVLAVYNGLNRAQRAKYATLTTNWERSIFLYGIAEEKKKPWWRRLIDLFK
ncbi:hypothetical protein C1646_754466 [Rhizophagus diaphanus]|nr:hypothetical protein C1646_754466 [Rhizophagus diaphanus] [Rhizophagus sp. MUCL 43196]